jgi:autotransporter strand-loop-strand O-heptosyltransferase
MKILGHASYVGNTGYNAHSKGFFRALSKKTQTKVRNFTVGPSWSGYIDKHNNPHNNDVIELDKNILISQSLFNADKNLQDFLLYNYDDSYIPDVNIILNSVNHYYFYQNYKGPKIAYVVWENTLYPEDFFVKLLEFDQVWVPTEWQAKITIDQGVPSDKVKIVREAVNPEIYNTVITAPQDDIFTFVMFGAWGDRKSTKDIIQSFINVFGNNNKVQLILSVANSFNGDGYASTEERLNKHNLHASNIKIVDFVSNDEYRKYMQTAHVFLSCARGEGWNIPLIEAMACGTPSIYSNCGGQLEFAKDLGIPVNIKGLALAKNFEDNKNQDSPGYWYEPDFNDLEKKMLEVYNNYPFHKEKAITECKYIRETFTWENAANAATLHLKDLLRNKVQLEVSCSFVGTGGLNSFCQELLPELNDSCKVKVRNFTIGKNWNGYNHTPHDLDIKDCHKNILHKQTLFNSDNSRSDYPIYNSESDFIPNVNLVMDGINHYYFYDHYIGPKIAYTMYETTKFPEDFLNQLKSFDQLWIPSQWQKNNLINQDFPECKLKVVPLGVDGSKFFPIEDKFDKFTFIIVGRWDARKSTMEMIRCFKDCFSNNENVQLLLLADNPFDIDGLGSTENRLRHFDLQNNNIKPISFTTRQEYISLLQKSHVFLSCSRAEGWNLPLIEAMACGTVSVYSDCSAQLEFAKKLGVSIKVLGQESASVYNERQFDKGIVGNYYIPDFKDFSNSLIDIYNNYDYYKNISIKESNIIRDNFSWKKAADIAKDNIFELLARTNKVKLVNFINDNKGIEYKNVTDKKIKINVKIHDTYKSSCIYDGNLDLDPDVVYYSTMDKDYDAKDKLKFTIFDDCNNLLLSAENSFNDFKTQAIDVINESSSLGDAIAWTGIVDYFQKKNNKQINFYTIHKNLFQDAYPNINFYDYWEKPLVLTEPYHIGCFDIDGVKWNQLGLQEIACKILKIKNKEIRSKVALPKNLKNNFKRKYVCIGSLSTSQAKFWNNASGWTRTVEYLNNLGYDVVSIDKNNNIGSGEYVNYIPVNSIDRTGDFPLSDRINDLHFCDFFIGLGSGLSWLAWAVGKPVVMISGFSDPISEFYTPYRVINKNVCNSCWNDPNLPFDKGNWAWCPRDKNFECSKEISFEMVKEKIDQCIKDLNKYS